MGEGDNKPRRFVFQSVRAGTLWSAIRCSKAQAQVEIMANDLLDKILNG
jgi:hypothetical protein